MAGGFVKVLMVVTLCITYTDRRTDITVTILTTIQYYVHTIRTILLISKIEFYATLYNMKSINHLKYNRFLTQNNLIDNINIMLINLMDIVI